MSGELKFLLIVGSIGILLAFCNNSGKYKSDYERPRTDEQIIRDTVEKYKPILDDK
jgi:hypothetical protein